MTNKHSEIYSLGYEKWEGERGRALPPWVLIGRAGLKNLVGSSGCLVRTIFIVFFVLYYALIIVGTAVRMQLENLSGRWEWLRGFAEAFNELAPEVSETTQHMGAVLVPSLVFTTLAMVFYGAQLISKDKRANALQVYFSKAISRLDYVLGKFFAVGIITSLTTLIPSALILLFGLMFTTDHLSFIADSWYIPILTGAYWLLLTAVFGSIALFFSSCFNKGYMAGVAIIGFSFFCLVFASLAEVIFGASYFIDGLNWSISVYRLGYAIYDLNVENWGATFWRVIDLAIISGGATWLLFRNIRPVEVVK